MRETMHVLTILLAMMHLGVIAHDTLIGKPNRKTLVLDIVGLAGRHKLPLVTTFANFNLTYVSRGTKSNTMSRFVGEMHRKLVDDGIGIVRHKLLLVSSA